MSTQTTTTEAASGAEAGEKLVFVIVRTVGEYSDRREDLIAATFDEGEAQRWAETTQRVCQQIAVETNLRCQSAETYDEKNDIRAEAKARCPDSDFEPYGCYAEDVQYSVWCLPIGLPSLTAGAAR